MVDISIFKFCLNNRDLSYKKQFIYVKISQNTIMIYVKFYFKHFMAI